MNLHAPYRFKQAPDFTTSHGLTGVFLDPPYDRKRRAKRIYAEEDDSAAPRARRWAIENGNNPNLRIVLCGLRGEHEMPPDWFELSWSTGGGYGNQADGRGRENAGLETMWFNRTCRTQFLLF